MIPATFPLDLYRGDTARFQFKFWKKDQTPVDLTGATAKAEIRDRPAGGIIATLDCTITLPNIVDMVLTEDNSLLLPQKKGVWDLQIRFATGDVLTPVAGDVAVTADVTESTQPYVEPLVKVVV